MLRLYDIAEKVVIVTGQRKNDVYATNALVSNLNGVNQEKYIFVCNKFKNEEYNALVSSDVNVKFPVNEYIEHFRTDDCLSCAELGKKKGIKKVAFLIV
jgi:hypothetical protein